MCGIAGLLGVDDPERAGARCRAMLEAMRHRGPDGLVVERVGAAALGHLRLAVIDPGETGTQPMVSADGRHAITFNGEIYNYRELRDELDAGARARWRGDSDTEVLIEAIARWGIEATLARVDGMFAFAVLDRRTGALRLARDRFGEKPLCYSLQGDTFAFASEIVGLEAAALDALTVSRRALHRQYLSYSIPAPLTVYDECRKLAPGHWLEWRPGAEPRIHRYWCAVERALASRARRFDDETEAVDALEAALARSVRSRMVADVPIGAFLSGGTDSALVVALMQAAGSRPVRTFTIGFDDPRYDESGHARAIAAHLGCDHHERIVTAEDALATVPELGALFDEPFADASQIPTWMVSRMARERVTVSLSGDAGDELFCGYGRYAWTVSTWAAIRRVPAHRRIGALLHACPPGALDAGLFFLKGLAARHGPAGRLGPRLRRFGDWMSSASLEEFYLRTIGRLGDSPVIGAEPTGAWEPCGPPDLDPLETMMLRDTLEYLPDDILVKTDRTAMSVGLEGRVPMLCPEVFETAWRLPIDMRRRGDVGKWALKQVLYRHVPRALMERDKRGFGAPVASWLRGALRDWACDLLSRARLERQGLYDADAIGSMLDAHLAGREDHAGRLWSVLMTQAWIDADPARAARVSEANVAAFKGA